jgi:cob(I)alamin adenosyltransferase
MFYTRKGDEGYTDLLGGRVPKYALRPETYGTLDEATSFLGFARALPTSRRTKEILIEIQRDLYLMMAELAFTPDMKQRRYHITAEHVPGLKARPIRRAGRYHCLPILSYRATRWPEVRWMSHAR